MEKTRCFFIQNLVVLSLFSIVCNFVQAETTECTAITSLPYTITTQGIYCLTSDLSTGMTSGSAITIATNNVVIDLNGHKLGGLAAGPGTYARGILAYQRKNITIRNGTVRGFVVGIALWDDSPFTTSQGHLVEGIRADLNTYYGIYVEGQGNVIQNNQVVSTGGTQTGATDAYGIAVTGPGVRVLNNDVIETKEQSTGSSYGIFLSNASGAVVENNRVGSSSIGPGTQFGILVTGSSLDALVSNNRVTGMSNGVYYAPGSVGKYRDNLTSGVTYPFTGGTDAGNNS